MPNANKEKQTPSRWPSDIEYLRTMAYSPSLHPSILQYVKGKGTAMQSLTRSQALIRRIDNPAHPAHDQMGLFAAKKIPPRMHIIDYFGEVHMDERVDSDYDLSLYRIHDDGGDVVNVGELLCYLNKSVLKIDAARMGNEARFINDYRGVRHRPNAVFKERRTEEGELRMSVWSGDTEAINKGDEILVSYGKAWWQAR